MILLEKNKLQHTYDIKTIKQNETSNLFLRKCKELSLPVNIQAIRQKTKKEKLINYAGGKKHFVPSVKE